MTDNEIIKALGCCANEGFQDCENCPLNIPHQPCSKVKLPRISLDLIKRKNAQIEQYAKVQHELMIEKDKLFDIAESQKAEIVVYERYIHEWDDKLTQIIEGFPLKCNSLRAEAIKEFAERLKAMSEYGTINKSPWQVDNLVKQMTEGGGVE